MSVKAYSPIRIWLLALLAALLVLALPLSGTGWGAPAAQSELFPQVIPLPNGFNPEGITRGRGLTFFVGSLADGSIYAFNARTGEGAVRVPPQEGRVAVGLGYDPRTNYIYASGGSAGAAYIYDAETGEGVAAYQLSDPPAFINDVVITATGAYFTNSMQPELYRLPLGPDGSPPDPSEVETITLGGDYTQVEGFNANGIDAPRHGRWLLIVQTATGTLYRVDPETGLADAVELGGASVPNGDGLLLQGQWLYVVQNFLNQISVVKLDGQATSGEVVDVITDPLFRIPTTTDSLGHFLYVVNARFDTPPTPETEYEVIRVEKR